MWKLYIFMPTKSDTVEPVSSGWSLKSENSPPPPQIIVAVTVTSIKQSLSTLIESLWPVCTVFTSIEWSVKV